MAARSRPAAGVTFGGVVLLLFGLILPAVYHSRYERTAPPGPPAAVAHPRPTAAQRAIFDRHAMRAPGLGLSLRGRDGYVFLGDLYQANVSQAIGWRFYNSEELSATTAVVRDERSWLARRNIASSFVVVPAKWDVYSDKLPRWTDHLRLTTTFDELRAYAPDTFPDIRAPLRAARGMAETYSRLNSHWSGYGGDVGYRAVLRSIQAADPRFADVPPPPEVVRTRTVDEFNEFANIHVPPPNDWTVPVYRNPLPSYHIVRANGSVRPRTGTDQLDMLTFPLETRSAAANSHRVLVLGDSATTEVSNLIAGSFHSALFVRHHLDEPEKAPNLPALVAAFHPDLVITLVSERNLLLPVAAQRPRWETALAYDAGTGERSLRSDGIAVEGAGVPLDVPTGGGTPLLALAGSGAAPVRITIRGGDAVAKPTTFRVGPGDWLVFVRLPAAGSYELAASGPLRLSSVSVRYETAGAPG